MEIIYFLGCSAHLDQHYLPPSTYMTVKCHCESVSDLDLRVNSYILLVITFCCGAASIKLTTWWGTERRRGGIGKRQCFLDQNEPEKRESDEIYSTFFQKFYCLHISLSSAEVKYHCQVKFLIDSWEKNLFFPAFYDAKWFSDFLVLEVFFLFFCYWCCMG